MPVNIREALLAIAVAAVIAPTANVQAQADWPSYNRTLTSERFSPLASINVDTAGKLKVACTFDTGEMTAFQSGLVMVNGALLATTEHDTISLDPNTCKQNWRAHEAFKDSYLGAQRGVAVAEGRVFRGAANGHVYAYEEKRWDMDLLFSRSHHRRTVRARRKPGTGTAFTALP
jgi:alcohol dehydrogenase (cytochrome c)